MVSALSPGAPLVVWCVCIWTLPRNPANSSWLVPVSPGGQRGLRDPAASIPCSSGHTTPAHPRASVSPSVEAAELSRTTEPDISSITAQCKWGALAWGSGRPQGIACREGRTEEVSRELGSLAVTLLLVTKHRTGGGARFGSGLEGTVHSGRRDVRRMLSSVVSFLLRLEL